MRGNTLQSRISKTRGGNFIPVFRQLPQGTLVVHRFRTAGQGFIVDEFLQIRESAVTAGVNVTLPVIAEAGSAAVFAGVSPDQAEGFLPGQTQAVKLLSGSQNVKALRAPGRCGPLRTTVSHGGTAASSAIGCAPLFSAGAPPVGLVSGEQSSRERRLCGSGAGHGNSGSPDTHAANAVWVAGPDRIFIWPSALSFSSYFQDPFSSPEYVRQVLWKKLPISLDIRLLFALWLGPEGALHEPTVQSGFRA